MEADWLREFVVYLTCVRGKPVVFYYFQMFSRWILSASATDNS